MMQKLPGLLPTILLTLAACSGSAKRVDKPFGIEPTTPEGAAMVSFFQGDVNAAATKAESADNGPTGRFARAEVYYAQGDVERAFDEWSKMLVAAPEHPLTRIAASRIYGARDEVTDVEARMVPLFEKLDYPRLHPLAKVYVSLLHQTLAYRQWSRSSSEEPFDADRFGFAARWLMTPSISPWRLTDFDTKFEPETAAHLAPKYLSPTTAKDVEANRDEVEPYWTSSITIYPGFRGTGVHYLESFATLEGSTPRDYWLYGNFAGATKVFVDGQLVFDRREDGYQTGKRMRMVRLTPGTHRILVKMAYQAGYRDWFDLVFMPADRGADEADLEFATGCLPDRQLPNCHEGGATPGAKVVLRTEEQLPSDLEPVLVDPEKVTTATDIGLWVTMIASHYDGQNEFFAPAWKELEGRRPKFAAGHALWAEQVQTLWQVPSRLRDARALQALRHAHELAPNSLKFATDLGRWLAKQGEEKEARAMLEKARDAARTADGRLRSSEPLETWAAHLGSQGWETQAEQAWRDVLAVDPSNCIAAESLQKLLYGRSSYVAPPKITKRHDHCPSLHSAWVEQQPSNHDARLALARRDAGRYPLRGDYHRNYASLLKQLGKDGAAKEAMRKGLELDPDSAALWAELADQKFADGDTDGAVKLLEQYKRREGNSAWITWKIAAMTGEIPLRDLMPDGRAEAVKVVRDGQDRSLSNDEAYFAVDFAARRYFPDGSKITLTHTVVRVMTKNAIDRYAEQNVPGNARILLARTIKQDGTVRVPEETAGKSTLSMPGLAEGDFVEMAYIEWDGPNEPPHHVEGIRFFFKMADISTLHSEYVVIGDIADFMRMNDAPKTERFDYQGLPAVRFLAKNNPRPRDEPRTVSIEEYLPWVQMYRQGQRFDDVEVFRRDTREAVLDSSKTDAAFESFLKSVTPGAEGPEHGSREWLKDIFYRVSAHIPDPNISPRAFNTDVNHAVLEKDGNSMLLFKVVLDRLGVENDVYLVRSKYQVPDVYPIREYEKYSEVVLRTVVPETKEVVWLSPDGPDAMFNALGPTVVGQPAICATCADSKRETVPTDGFRAFGQSVRAKGKLDAKGDLQGTVTYQFEGVSAHAIRAGLRARTDETSRIKFADSLAASLFPGAAAKRYGIENELAPDEPLRFVVEFERPGFARDGGNGTYQIETRLFREALASGFAALPQRTTPLFMGYAQNNDYRFELDIEGFENIQILGRTGEQRFDSPHGSYRRSTTLNGKKLVVESAIETDIQRVGVGEYPAFQKWALDVEQSSGLLVRLGQ